MPRKNKRQATAAHVQERKPYKNKETGKAIRALEAGHKLSYREINLFRQKLSPTRSAGARHTYLHCTQTEETDRAQERRKIWNQERPDHAQEFVQEHS